MPTGQQIINGALKTLNVVAAGGSASPSVSADLLDELNVMVDGWSTEETLIPSILTSQYSLTANQNPYALGPIAAGFAGAVLLQASKVISAGTNANPAVLTYSAFATPLVTGQVVMISGFTGGWAAANGAQPIIVLTPTTFSIPVDSTGFGAVAGAPVVAPTAARPVRIDQALLVATVGGATTRKPLTIVGSKQYFGHGDLAAAAATADELYPDLGEVSGAMELYLFPVPSCPTATKLELETWNAIAAFALGVNQNLPPGYQDALQNGLAFRALPRFGAAVDAQTAQIVAQLGASAKDRVKTLNVQNRLLDPALAPATENQLRAQQPQQQR